MSKKFTREQLVERVVRAGADLVAAESVFRKARYEIKAMYDTYFRAHGRPEGEFLPYAEEFQGVVEFTAGANARRAQARQQVHNACRRLERAVLALKREGWA